VRLLGQPPAVADRFEPAHAERRFLPGKLPRELLFPGVVTIGIVSTIKGANLFPCDFTISDGERAHQLDAMQSFVRLSIRLIGRRANQVLARRKDHERDVDVRGSAFMRRRRWG